MLSECFWVFKVEPVQKYQQGATLVVAEKTKLVLQRSMVKMALCAVTSTLSWWASSFNNLNNSFVDFVPDRSPKGG